MDCVQRSSALIPVANASFPANATLFYYPSLVWRAYLSNSQLSEQFDNTTTLESVRQSLESCGEWDNACQNPSQIFINLTNLGVYSLYPDLTTKLNASIGRTTATQGIDSVISTCLISYCALEPSCSSHSTSCSTNTLITQSGLITRDGPSFSQGVGRCWRDICCLFFPSVNPDIGGVGVSQSTSQLEYHLLIISVDHLLIDADCYCPASTCSLGNLPSAKNLPVKEEEEAVSGQRPRSRFWKGPRSDPSNWSSTRRRPWTC